MVVRKARRRRIVKRPAKTPTPRAPSFPRPVPQPVRHIEPGDTVAPRLNLHVSEVRAADDTMHWEAKPDRKQDAEGPPRVFDAVAGIYLGTHRIPEHRTGAATGVVDKLKHVFYFNSRSVVIDPEHVKLLVSFDDAVGD